MNLKVDAIEQALHETIYDFMTGLIPIENIDQVSLEPIDVLRIDPSYIFSAFQQRVSYKVVDIETTRISRDVTLFISDILRHTLRELYSYGYKELRETYPLTYALGRYYLEKYITVKFSLDINIESITSTNNLEITLLPTFILLYRIPVFRKTFKYNVPQENIEKIVENILTKTEKDLKSTHLISRTPEYIGRRILSKCSNVISQDVLNDLHKYAMGYLDFSNLRFIPFGRSILFLGLESASHEPFEEAEFLRDLIIDFYPSIIASYVHWVSKGRKLLIENKLGEKEQKLLKASAPLLEGTLSFDGSGRLLYNDWRNATVEMQFSSALVGEVSGLILPLLTASNGSLVLIEEPEAQLHPGAQIVMALFLASLPSLCGCKIVASTHSDLLAITLSQLTELKPNKEWIEELIRELIPHMGENVETLADIVAQSVSGLDLKIYEFTREGIIKPAKPEDVLRKEVPGISRVIDNLTDWAFRLASYKESQG